MARYSDGLEKINLGFDGMEDVSGGMVKVNLSDVCHKESGVFSPLDEKAKKWKKAGNPKTCEFCWYLKYDNGFFCDA